MLGILSFATYLGIGCFGSRLLVVNRGDARLGRRKVPVMQA
jgi:hypothetical protein